MILRRHIEQSHYTSRVLFSYIHLFVARNTRSGTWCDYVAVAKPLHVTTAKASREILFLESTVGRLATTQPVVCCHCCPSMLKRLGKSFPTLQWLGHPRHGEEETIKYPS